MESSTRTLCSSITMECLAIATCKRISEAPTRKRMFQKSHATAFQDDQYHDFHPCMSIRSVAPWRSSKLGHISAALDDVELSRRLDIYLRDAQPASHTMLEASPNT